MVTMRQFFWRRSLRFHDFSRRKSVSLWHGRRFFSEKVPPSMTSIPSAHRAESATFGILLTNIFWLPVAQKWNGTEIFGQKVQKYSFHPHTEQRRFCRIH